MRFQILGIGFMDYGLWFMVYDSWFMVYGQGSSAKDVGFRV